MHDIKRPFQEGNYSLHRVFGVLLPRLASHRRMTAEFWASKRWASLCAVVLSLCAVTGWAASPEKGTTADSDFDLVIYGGTPAGIVAAVQGDRLGLRVVLIEPHRLGGMTSGGLGATDFGQKKAIGGLAKEFYRRVKQHYTDPEAWLHETAAEYKAHLAWAVDEDAMWTFEPHVAARVFNAMLAETAVEVKLGERLDLADGVQFRDGRIVAIKMESGKVYAGRIYIDATYEGDLLARSGVRYCIGRESNHEYRETLNGSRVDVHGFAQFKVNVDPYVQPGDPSSGLVAGIESGQPAEPGTGDHRIQAYNFRICATDVPSNRIDWPKPAMYDPSRYELLLRNLEAGDARLPWSLIRMPNGKTDANSSSAVSTDNVGMNYDYVEANYEQRTAIVREHESYQKGLFWTLAHNPRVPAPIRENFRKFGLSRDEFIDNDHWPSQLYIREARRMVSGYVMTERNCRDLEVAEDSVGLGSYAMDSHAVRRYVDGEGHVRTEGEFYVAAGPPYPISYRAIIPTRGECTNLLVPVCLSASHVAYGSIRMEPVFMILGQSAATAAAHALEEGIALQDVNYERLRSRLLNDGQILEWDEPLGPLSIRKLAGHVVDDSQAEFTGTWTASASAGRFVGSGYSHDSNQDKGRKEARFPVRLPQPGRYEVRLAYTHAGGGRASNVPVTVHHDEGQEQFVVNQRQAPTHDGCFISLGTFAFGASNAAAVVVETHGTDGYVIVDAVQFLPDN